jgi:hypothetical protein
MLERLKVGSNSLLEMNLIYTFAEVKQINGLLAQLV